MILVTEIYDEQDELLAYGLCRQEGENYTMLPAMFGTRSQAHEAAAAAEKAAADYRKLCS